MAVARHVAAHAHFGARRRLQEEVRIETGDRLQPEERNREPLGERAQLFLRQVAVRPLDAAELVEDGRRWSATLHGATKYIRDFGDINGRDAIVVRS